MHTRSLLFISIIICLLGFTSAEYCNQCKPGTYCMENPEIPSHSTCYLCHRGFYCPGDALYHVCPEGTASEEYGTVACKKCDQGRSSVNRTYCLLQDAPLDIHLQQLGNKISTLKLKHNEKQFFTTAIETGYNMPVQLALVMFRNIDGAAADEINLELFGSATTGKPTAENFAQHVGGVSSITIPFVYSKETEFFGWYYSLSASLKKKNSALQRHELAPLLRSKKQLVLAQQNEQQEATIQAGVSYHANNLRTLSLNEQDIYKLAEYEFFIDREHGVDYWTYLFFKVNVGGHDIAQGTVLNITSITYNDSCSQTLLYSEHAPLNPYPHAFTRDIVADLEEMAKTTKLNYVTRPRPVTGPAYFVVSPDCIPYETTPKLRLILHAVKLQ